MPADISDKPYGWRARIGYTSPPLTTEVFPYEFYKLVPDGVSLVVTSLAITVRSKEEIDQSYEISMKAAREMKVAGCNLICLGGVPINVSRGQANAEQMIVDLERELGITQPTLSQQLGVLRDEALVSTRRDGKRIHYRVASAQALALLTVLHDQFCPPTDSSLKESLQ